MTSLQIRGQGTCHLQLGHHQTAQLVRGGCERGGLSARGWSQGCGRVAVSVVVGLSLVRTSWVTAPEGYTIARNPG